MLVKCFMAKYARANPSKWWKTRSVGRGHRSPHAMFVSPWRRLISLAALLVLATIIAALFYLMSPKRLSRMASIVLSHVLDGHVFVASAHLSLAGTLQLTGVTLRTHRGNGPGQILFSAHQVQLGFNWLGLITGRLHAQRLVAIDPTLNLVHNLDTDRWNYQNLIQARKSPSAATSNPIHSLPVILLQHATIRWGRITHGNYHIAGQSYVEGRLQPRPGVPSTYEFEIDQQTHPGGPPGIHVTGSWNLSTQDFVAHIRHLALDHALRRSLPLEIRDYLLKYNLQGDLADIVFGLNPTNGITLRCALNDVTLQLPLVSRQGTAHHLAVTDLSGILRFSRSAMTISHLTGKLMGNTFQVPAAVFDGYSSGMPFQLTLLIPHLNIPQPAPAILQMRGFGAARAVFNRLRPSGTMALTLAIERATAGEIPAIHGQIVLHNVQARYVHFPYPLHQVHGVVDFSARAIHFVHVQGLAETFPCALNGLVGINSDTAPINLQISSNHAFFDRRLADCLPRAIHRIWNRFHPHGTGRFICHVTRTAGTTTAPLIAIDIFPTDVRASYRDFPYPLKHVHGELYFTPTRTKIIRLSATGPAHQGKITFTGTVNYNPHNLASMQPQVRLTASAVPLDRRLLQSLPRYYQAWIAKLHATGLVSMNAMITRGAKDQPAVVGTIGLTHGMMRPPELPWPLSHVHMQAHIDPEQFNMTQLTAQAGAAKPGAPVGTLQMQADIQTQSSRRSTVRASGAWWDIAINHLPPTALPPRWKALWAKWRPAGSMNGTFKTTLVVHKHSAATMGTVALTHLDIRVLPQKMSLSPVALPTPISNLTGIIHITKTRVALHHIAAAAGPIWLQAGGSYVYKTHTLSAHGQAQSNTIAAAWIAKLPVKPRNFIAPLAPDGHWRLQLKTLTRTPLKTGALWSFQGGLKLNDLATHGAIQSGCEHLTTHFRGSWNTRDPAPSILANFALSGFSIAGQTLHALTGKLSTSPVTRLLKVDDLSGAIAGGAIAGHVSLSIHKKPAFYASLILDHAELADLLSSPGRGHIPNRPPLPHPAVRGHPTRPTPAPPRPLPVKPQPPVEIHPETSLRPATRPANAIVTTRPAGTATADTDDHPPNRIPSKNTGQVTASFQMRGIWGETNTMRGDGILLVRHADIYNVPLAMGLLQVATLRLPVSHAFQYCKIVYVIDHGIIHFKKIILTSPGVNLDGRGSLHLTSQRLHLTLVTHSPPGTRIPVLGLLVGLVRSQLLQLQVYGTLEHPTVIPTALNILELPFRIFSRSR